MEVDQKKMFREIRYQTGESLQVFEEMKNGGIPCLEVLDHEDFESFAERLEAFGIKKSDGIPYDKNARDGVKEPEFEFRAAFHSVEAGKTPQMPDTMYIDVYFEPEIERTYDPMGEM
jgi:hypothetical protein